MAILSRIRLPNSADNLDLYVKFSKDKSLEYNYDDRSITLSSEDCLSSNTYFNSFYETYFLKYTTISKLYFLLNLEGCFSISVYREDHNQSDRQLLHQQTIANCQFSSPFRIDLPELTTQQTGRIYFELTCLSNQGLFKESWIATDEIATHPVNLGIISCTYKKEAYITKTVNTILDDSLLRDKLLSIFVVDNGQTLSSTIFADSRVHLIPNRNLGGSGGFTKGLVEAYSTNTYTHFLFMDDDIELDSEVVYRLISLYEYAKSDIAIAGAMFDLHKKHSLFEAGAHFARSLFREGFDPFELRPLKNDLDLREPTVLNSLQIEEKIDYGGFWFFAFPQTFVNRMGLPLPFFIKGDDIEFGLRITSQLKEKIISFPAIGVWHEPFYAKFPVWDSYYYFRNLMIVHAIQGSLSYSEIVKEISNRLIYLLLFFDYNSATMIVKAFEDFLQGPAFIKQHNPETYHREILRLSKSHQNQTIDYSLKPMKPSHVSKAGILRRVASLLTLNGHFLPDIFISSEPALIWYAPGYPGQRSRALARKKIHIYKEKMNCVYTYEMDRQSGRKILLDWFKLVWKSWACWAKINCAWKESAPEFISLDFWQTYLQPQKGVNIDGKSESQSLR